MASVFFPLQIRELNAGQALHSELMKFKTAIPLMASFKNESLRMRHWQLLMLKTGHEFGTDDGNFELKHVFEMKLYKHNVSDAECVRSRLPFLMREYLFGQSAVTEIIRTAEHEVLIEVKMNELAAKWNRMEFAFSDHSFGNARRGFVLEKTESIIQNVEDDCMQLQIVSTSP